MMLPVTLNPRLQAAAHDPFAGPALESFVPLTEPQREIWLAALMDVEANLAFNEGLDLVLRGALNVGALRAALRMIVARHESLRGVVSPDGRSMCVLADFSLEIPLHDLRLEADPQAALAGAQEALMRAPFDLERGPLLRCELFRTGEDLHHLVFLAHHVVCDGWSAAVVMTELGALYSASVEGRDLTLPYVPSRYGDYASIEAGFLRSEEGQTHEKFWLQALADAPPPLDLPSSFARPAQRSYSADRYDHPIDAALVARLRQIGAAQGCSLVVTLLAAFSAQLHRLAGATDMVIGLAAAGQALHNQLKLVGHCVNLLPLRFRPQGEMQFDRYMVEVKKAVLDAFDHQGVTFGTLVPKLKLDRDESRPPLLSVIFNIDVRDDDISHTGLEVKYETLVRRGENFELFINVVDNGHDLVLEASYNAQLFSRADIQRILKQYQGLLERICQDTAFALSSPDAADREERTRILGELAGSVSTIPGGTLHEAILRRALREPQAVAVEFGADRWSLAHLVGRADAIASALQEQGVAPGQFVGVYLSRSAELVAALLAVLKCGAAYLPLDPELPLQRVQFMLDDAGARVLLTEAALEAQAPGAALRVLIDALPQQGSRSVSVEVPPESPAYAIYTSGSTGQPKGVVAHHRGVLNCLAGTVERIPIAANDGMLALATYAFDASVLEIFLPLVHGGRLAIITREEAADGVHLAAAIARHDVTRIFTAPAAWRLLLAAGWAGKPDLIGISWAEPLTRELAAQLLPRLRELWNLYGPTETTVWMLGCRITGASERITIGRPLPNTSAYVLDATGQPVPVGVTGELYIGGAGVATGYLNREELTAERFVADPFRDGRMYRTGDLARWQADDQLECLGRIDFQVKLRGYRIELGEIEAELNRHPAVAESVCGVRERGPGDPRLVAWITARPGTVVNPGELREHLRRSLPAYMVPQTLRELDALPRLSNGKLDRKSLPDAFAGAGAPASAKTAPGTASQIALRDIWAEILGVSDIGIEDRFFDLGGHSLLAVQSAAKIQKIFGVRLPLRTVMMESLFATAESIDREISSAAPAAAAPATPATESAATGAVQQPAEKTEQEAESAGSLSRLKRWLRR